MNLSEMKPAELWAYLESTMSGATSNWDCDYGKSLRAELKTQFECEEGRGDYLAEQLIKARRELADLVARRSCPCPAAPEPACPMLENFCIHCGGFVPPCHLCGQYNFPAYLRSVWGQGKVKLTLPACPKCGKIPPDVPRPPELPNREPCLECYRARPDAPEGYEFTDEWDKPNGRPFISVFDGLLCTVDPPDTTDGGKRWILRKRAEPEPSAFVDTEEADPESMAEKNADAIIDLTRRVEKLEKEQG